MDWIEAIKQFEPCNEQEATDKQIILQCIMQYDNLLTRQNPLAHMTSSAFVLNKNRDKTLMIHHNIYNAWAWTGGHMDGEDDFLKVAIKELQEETGIKDAIPLTEAIGSLDILEVPGHIKRGKYVAPHLHLSVAYLIEVDENEPLQVKPDENSGVQWIPLEELMVYTANEPYMQKVYQKLINRALNK